MTTPRINRREMLTIAAGLSVASLQAHAPTTAGLVEGQPEAARAGTAVLASGGNAVDAAVTAALVATVVAPHSCGIGGYGGHMMIAEGAKVHAIDFNCTAPAAA